MYPSNQQPPYQQPYYPPPQRQGMSTGTKVFLFGCLGLIILASGSCVACSLIFNNAVNRLNNANISTANRGTIPPGSSNANPSLSNTESTSKWMATELTSEMDSSKGYGVALIAENEIEGRLKKATPKLYVRCREKKIDLFINLEMGANIEYGGGHMVRLRFDDAQPIIQNWEQSTDNEALFFKGDTIGLARKIAQAQTLKFKFVPFKGSPQTVQFDVRGFQSHLDKLLSICKTK
jgi:type VI secretion system protein VasI